MIRRDKYLNQLISAKDNGFTIIGITDFLLKYI